MARNLENKPSDAFGWLSCGTLRERLRTVEFWRCQLLETLRQRRAWPTL
ncbi:hypothetical protein LC653_23005 [Nostoc sp. CHAB 5784]|nr:hypothetical protein [Nostoc mirabile]MCC5666677.1 hypothetical protein [Nostoc mirabile CHAB5784]